MPSPRKKKEEKPAQPVDPARLSVWTTAQKTQPVQRRGRYVPEQKAHPARMYPATAAHAIAAFTVAGDLVMDPMAGIGTTLVEAMHLGRDAIGIEYESRWADIADANVQLALTQGAPGRGSIIRGDSTALTRLLPAVLHGRVALVVTSPPYGSTVHGLVDPGEAGISKEHYRYGDDKGNLAYRSTEALIDGFTQILDGCRQVLRPGGIVVVTVRPFRAKGRLIDLPSAVVSAGRTAGLVPVAWLPASLGAVRDGRIIARPSFFQLGHVRKQRAAGVPMHLIAHEDVVLLRAPAGPPGVGA
ncbi:hypothetical protein GCM10010123_19890 [Pilimelia anulata]|uniref:Methyltransferase n=1 Tax=Pilimelia anulata TaxID=53371 RepID=A0A8J3B2P3_9ACTN|nr:DNA methyltransferase [Pilimelia anulata]GGJ90068.1 hypothetical protein GCM10010123_19890 [Pilimelia anulata]